MPAVADPGGGDPQRAVSTVRGIDDLISALRREGFRVIGPAVRDGAIIYDEIASTADLPAGWTDEQEGGSYRLVRREDDALFGYNVGPQSWKRFLFPPSSLLWQGRTDDGSFTVDAGQAQDDPRGGELAGKYAFIGVRSCELHAIAIQDRVFLRGEQADPVYSARRDGVFIVAVNCGQAGGTCFCTSMGTGPRAEAGFDLALTELLDGGERLYLAEPGSASGERILSEIDSRPATARHLELAEQAWQHASDTMGRSMETTDIHDLLLGNLEHPRWDDVAARCLSCGNCTMACPTCFCFRIEDATDLAGGVARTRSWDSCFTMDHSYIHGGPVRASGRARYRQWMTHKLATWIDQFGTSGCVGCGRCITWCPVGIDLTEEVAAIRADDARVGQPGEVHDADA